MVPYVILIFFAFLGWDFSSRWMETIPASEEQEMLEIKTGNIIPVDLNSFLCKNARILSILFNKVENEENASKYHNISRNLKVWRSLVSVSE